MTIPPGEFVRLTEAEVLSHPLYRGFGPLAHDHPPMRGWLATSVCGDDSRVYGMLQLSDKSGGRDFDAADETNIHELAALVGEMRSRWSSGRPERVSATYDTGRRRLRPTSALTPRDRTSPPLQPCVRHT